ncbi:MAG TPA: hypothetical protein VLL51_00430 [Gemmatimonadales bacterium]|nr:hypothetical protein [Gemmatimonadales bacterium]
MSRHRITYAALSFALAALIAAVVWLFPSGGETGLPRPLQRVFPGPGDSVVRQTAVEVDLPVGYTIELWVDGDAVPPDEIGATPSTGRFTWQPGPGLSKAQWPGGDHTIRFAWARPVGRPDPGEFEWTFRVQ